MRVRSLLAMLCLGGGLCAEQAPLRIEVDADGRQRAAGLASSSESPDPSETDRAENGGFDAGQELRAWSAYLAPYGVAKGSAAWSPDDALGQRGSGSVVLENAARADGPRDYGLQQCLRPARPLHGPARLFRTRFSLNVAPGQDTGAEAWVGASVIFFTSPDCSDGFVGGGGVGAPVSAAGTGGWVTLNPDWSAGAQFFVPGTSALLSLIVHKSPGSAAPLRVQVDNVGVRGSFEAAKGDLNGDGETDLMLREAQTGLTAAWFMRDESRLAPPATLEPQPKADWHVAGVDDFDGDGRQDLLMWNAENGATEFWLMNGTSRVGEPLPLAGALAPPWKPAAVADFDGDGRPDLLYRDATLDKLAKQRLRVWLLKGTSHAGTLVPDPDHARNFNWDVAAARDIDGDGQTDLLWFNRHSGRVVYWLLDAGLKRRTGAFTNPPRAGDTSWRLVAAGDFGLGPSSHLTAAADSVDLVWRNSRTGRLAVWFMDKRMNRTGGRLIAPDPPAPASEWIVAGPR